MADDLEHKRFAARWRHLEAPVRRPVLLRTPSPVAPETPLVAHTEPVPLTVAERYARRRG